LIQASEPGRSLSHAVHHNAEIQQKANICNAKFIFSNQLNSKVITAAFYKSI